MDIPFSSTPGSYPLAGHFPRVRAAGMRRVRTREALLRSAERAFAEHGWAATRVEDVAREARVSPATAYNHFPTKHALIAGSYAAVWFRSADTETSDAVASAGPPGGRESLPAVAALAAHLLCISRISREHRRLTAAFACAIQDYTARVERRPVGGDPADPRLKVPVPAGITHHLETAQRHGELGTQRDAADLAEQLTFLLFLRCFTHPDEAADETASMLLGIVVGVLRRDS